MGKDKKNKFKTPEGYFDSFHDRLMDRIQQEEAEQAASVIPKSDGFAEPDGYFENLTPKLVAQIEDREDKVISLNSRRKYYYGAITVAAVLLLFFGLTWDNAPSVTFDDLANAEIDAYFESLEYDLSTNEIAEALSSDQIDLSDILDQNLGEEHILEYLDENVEDIEDLNLDYNDYE